MCLKCSWWKSLLRAGNNILGAGSGWLHLQGNVCAALPYNVSEFPKTVVTNLTWSNASSGFIKERFAHILASLFTCQVGKMCRFYTWHIDTREESRGSLQRARDAQKVKHRSTKHLMLHLQVSYGLWRPSKVLGKWSTIFKAQKDFVCECWHILVNRKSNDSLTKINSLIL